MATFIVSMERTQKRSSDPKTLAEQILHITDRGTAGTRSIWECTDLDGLEHPKRVGGDYIYKARATFERRSRRSVSDPARLTAEMNEVVKMMKRASNSTNWKIRATTHDWPLPRPNVNDAEAGVEKAAEEHSNKKEETDFIDFDQALTHEQITIPPVLVYGEDSEIEVHPAFNTIYGRGPHIRIMAAAMSTMLKSKGRRRNHHVLHGLPGCGKSSLFHGWQQVIGKGGYLSINANSATRAGIEGLFLSRLKDVGVPPFLFVEEIEKTLEQILTVWLSIMDDRAEVRKIIHGKLRHAIVRSLVFATANDKVLFDKMMGGRPGHPGALSSRMTGIYVPRPDWEVMERILLRDIGLYYPEAGKDSKIWAKKCIEIAKEVGTNDPRTVTCFLDGRDRLLKNDYKEDIIRLHRLEEQDRKIQKALEAGSDEEEID